MATSTEIMRPLAVLQRWPAMSDGHRATVGDAALAGMDIEVTMSTTFVGAFIVSMRIVERV